jgi:plastocyanin
MKKLLMILLATVSLGAFAQAQPEFRLVIENHKFTPDAITVPAGQKVKLVIENKDATPEEFESKQLNREKVIPGKSTGAVFIGPLKPGEYKFVGEFNEKTARGVIIVK